MLHAMRIAPLLALAVALPASATAAPTTVEIDGFVSRTPATWDEEPAGPMRHKQFRLPPAKGDSAPTELVIFFFGKAQGGSATDNVNRWIGMFERPESKTTEETIAGVKTTLVEITGTYVQRSRPMDRTSPAERREHHRMIGVVLETPNGPYFMRLVGPDASVKQHRADFLKWLRAFKKQ
jgi:hypothetical protein